MPRRHARQINLRLTEPQRRRLEGAAKEREISINQLIRQLAEEGLEVQALASYLAALAREVRVAIEHSARKEDIETKWKRLSTFDALSARFYSDVEQLLIPDLQDPKVRDLLRGSQKKGGKS